MTAKQTPEQTTFAGEVWGSKTLAGDFILPPFDSISTQRGEWQSRKHLWIDILGLGKDEDMGRNPGLISNAGEDWRMVNPVRQPRFYEQKAKWEQDNGKAITTGEFKHLFVPKGSDRVDTFTSQFDPVLAEVMLHWYTITGWRVFDPFGGGVERGLVSAYLGRPYVGIELRPEQVLANRSLADRVDMRDSRRPLPAEWLEGDARETKAIMADYPAADFILTCPPYWNLEKYSDLPDDVSNMSLPNFLQAMDVVIEASLAVLKPDRFAVMVMGDRRYGARKQWAHLPHMMTASFEAHGALLHNDIVLTTALGSKPQVARYSFERRRTLMPLYEHVLVFCKGDAKTATQALGETAEQNEASLFLGSKGQYTLI